MTMKSLLLGAAAGIATIGAAQAADLPMTKADAVEYVKVCSQFGPGFFYIPGSDTCLQISGNYRADYQVGSTNDVNVATPHSFSYVIPFGPRRGQVVTRTWTTNQRGTDKAMDSTNFQGRAQLAFDARTQTDWGLLRSYLLIDMYTGSSGPSNWSTGKNFSGSSGLYMDKAYIQFGGLTAGWAESFFAFYDAFYGNTYFAPYFGSGGVGTKQQLAYTAQFGGGFSATLAVEDPKAYQSGINDSGFGQGTAETLRGAQAPNIIANVNYTGDIGKFQLMGALHQVQTLGDDISGNGGQTKWGYALGAGAAVNIPVLAGGYIAVEGDYANGANSFTGVSDNTYSPAGSPTAYDGYLVNGRIKTADSWAVTGEAGVNLTPQIKAMLFGSYGKYNAPSLGAFRDSRDFTAYQFGGQLSYTVVKGLTIGAEVYYAKTQTDQFHSTVVQGQGASGVTLFDKDNDAIVGGLRIQRTF